MEILFGIFLLTMVSPAWASPTAQQNDLESSDRDGRPFFAFITVAPESCKTTSTANPDGTCYSSKDCTNLSGTASGKCAQGLGVCCYFTRTCSQTISTNSTSFVNPSSPNTDTTSNNCVSNIQLIGNNICQLRLDFTKFELAQPNTGTGVCTTDFFSITGTANDNVVPMLCGKNTGQHMYVDVNPNSNPQIQVDMGTSSMARQWEIKVTQIPCTSQYKAPAGCRQYYTGTSGTVTSFNYVQPASEAEITAGSVNLHLANQDYRVCIATQANYCSITWMTFPTGNLYAFMMTADANANSGFIGTDALYVDPYADPACTDYVSVPGSTYTYGTTTGQADRYCGLFFPTTVTSSSQPFYLHVKTDADETNDVSNAGFSLEYRMLPC